MPRLLPFTAAGLACCALAACATPAAETAALSRAETVTALRADPHPGRVNDDTARARASMAWGDRWTAANLFEQAAADRSDIVTRFNLATGYQRTGRRAQAAALYRELVRDGQYRSVVIDAAIDPATGKTIARPQRVNVADEAARRLAVLEPPAALTPPRTAEEAGSDVAAVERGPRSLSDEEALARDVVQSPSPAGSASPRP